MTQIFIEGGRALIGGEVLDSSLSVAQGRICAVGAANSRGALHLDASGLLVLPLTIESSITTSRLPRISSVSGLNLI